MRGLEDWRQHQRLEISGQVSWSDGNVEGQCRLVNLSAGGIRIADPTPELKVGTHLTVTITINSLRLESVPVDVVRTPHEGISFHEEDGLGLRFLDPSPQFRAMLDNLVVDILSAP